MLVTSFDLFISGVVLGLFCFVSFVAGARLTDRKYIQRAQQRAEQANRIARNMRRNDTVYDVLPQRQPSWADQTAVLPRVEATEEAQYRAHA